MIEATATVVTVLLSLIYMLFSFLFILLGRLILYPAIKTAKCLKSYKGTYR